MNLSKYIFVRFLAACLLIVLFSACSGVTPTADEKLITGDPRDFLLKPADLPEASAFYTPENGAFVIPNETAILAFGKEKGEALIAEEERLVAWRVHYQANKAGQPGPQTYLATIVQHQSAKGAQMAVEKYNNAALFPDGGWKIEEAGLKLGDKTIVEIGATGNQQGRRAINYRIEYAYRNISVDILVYGLEDQVSIDSAVKAARAILFRLMDAPLGNGPIPTPNVDDLQ